MTYLLDTNACIAIINGAPRNVRARFEREVDIKSELTVPSVAVFELWYGVVKSTRIVENTRLLEEFLNSPVAQIVFDSSDARMAGEIRLQLDRMGRPIGSYDTLIAAQAVRRGLILVTANEREFRRVQGLRWENWA